MAALLRHLAAAAAQQPLMHDWEWGLLFGFLGSLLSSASKLMIRKSWLLLAAVDAEAEAEAEPPPPDHHHRTTSSSRTRNWRLLPRVMAAALALRWSGLLSLSVLGPVLDVLALSRATPSLLAPFSGLSLAWIVLCSEPLIGERPSPPEVLASGLVGLGVVLTSACGDRTNPGNHETLEDLVRARPFVCWLVGLIV